MIQTQTQSTRTSTRKKIQFWELILTDPSGTKTTFPLYEGRVPADVVHLRRNATPTSDLSPSPENIPLELTVTLRDSELPPEIGSFVWEPADTAVENKPQDDPHPTSPLNTGSWWLHLKQDTPAAQVAGVRVREAQIPSDIEIHLGNCTLKIQPHSTSQKDPYFLPEFPPQVRPWLSRSATGSQLIWQARKIADAPLSVYINGETGTGKEIIAHLLHAWSPRKTGAFVALNCAALSVSLIESELFGHIKGAYTGADQSRRGALMQANGGTLFLDEVADLPLEVQTKLLRFLESGEVRPVGSDQTLRSDVRVVCATHLPLKKLVAEGRFRRDLYFRLASVTLEIPPLRDRPEDITLLARAFAAENQRTLSAQAIHLLQTCRWAGNVRELRHAIDRASALNSSATRLLGVDAFDWLKEDAALQDSPEILLQGGLQLSGLPAACVTLVDMERAMILRALRLTGGNRTLAAQRLGIARSTLFERMKKLEIRPTRNPYGE
jgi:DNA-binding NtrC family response regulator